MLKMKHIIYRCNYFAVLFLVFTVQISHGKENAVLIHPAPIVNFEISHFCLEDTAYFTNKSLLSNSYEWDIYKVANGPHGSVYDSLIFTSFNFNIDYLFSSGHYAVVLHGYNGHTSTVKRNLTIDSITHSNFDYTSCGSKFVNVSVCYNTCLWDFGDGKTSTQDSPVHFFDTLSTWYTVKLTTYNTNSADTYTDSIYATSPNNLNGNFRYVVNKDSVLFMADDSISGPFTSYHWSFGDGVVVDLVSFSGGRRLYHTYTKKDTTYTVFLLVKTSCLNAFGQASVFVADSTPVNGTYIYPNPVSQNSLLSIATEHKKKLKDIHVIDCLGKAFDNLSLTETFKGFNMDISGLAKGMYFVRLNFEDEIITKKLLIE